MYSVHYYDDNTGQELGIEWVSECCNATLDPNFVGTLITCSSCGQDAW